MDLTDFATGKKRKKRKKPKKIKKKVTISPSGTKTTTIKSQPKKKKKKKKKGLLKRIGKGIVKGVKKVAQATVGQAALLPLRPFTKAMKKALKKRGVNVKGIKFRSLVSKFYNEFVSKKGNKSSHYEEINETDFYNDISFYTPLEGFDYETDNAIVGAIIDVVNGIIDLFKKSKDKKKKAKQSGMTKKEYKETVTEDEAEFANEADKVEKKLVDKAKEDKIVKTGDMKKYLIYGGIVVILGVAVYLFSRKR